MYIIEADGIGGDRRFLTHDWLTPARLEDAIQYRDGDDADRVRDLAARDYPRTLFTVRVLDGGCECDGDRCGDVGMPCEGDIEVAYTAKSDGKTLLLCYPCYAEVEHLERG